MGFPRVEIQRLTTPGQLRLGVALALALGLASCPSRAGDALSENPLSLESARALALARNGDFRSTQFQVDAALAQLKVAKELPNPTLGLSTAKISTDGTPENTALGNGAFSRAYDSIVSLSQLILVSKRGLMRDSANAGVRAAQSQLDDARRLLLQAVTQTYVAALAARDQAEVLSASAAALRREADIAEHRFRAGDLSRSDRARIEIAAEQDELGAASQAAAAKAAVVALETLVGSPKPDGTTQLSDSLGQIARPTGIGTGGDSVLKRPDIAAAEAAVDQAEANLRLARHQRVPDVTLSIQFERNPPAQPDTVGMGLSLPLPVWSQYNGEILGAMAARNQALAHLDRVRVQAAADVAAARVAYGEASARAEKYQASLVPKSSEATASVAYSYEQGGAALIDLLDARRTDNDIRIASVQAQADAATALSGLLGALGRL